jgi:hypothetical protein
LKKPNQRRKTTKAPNPAKRGAPRLLTEIEQQMLRQKEEEVHELERKLAAENEKKALIRRADLEHIPEVVRRKLIRRLKPKSHRASVDRTQSPGFPANLTPSAARAVKLLISKLSEMRERFGAALHEHSFWPDEPDSLSARKGNAQHFEWHRKTWADAANAALGETFRQLVPLLIRKGNTKKRAASQTQKILRQVIQEHCNMVPILEGISMPTLPASLPRGIGDENDGIQSFSNKFQQPMLSHLDETAEETLLRFDLDLVSQPPRAKFQNPAERGQPQDAVPAQSGESRLPAIIAKVARITSTKGTEWRSKRRAWLVAQVLEEVQMIREAEMPLDPEVPSDFESVIQRFKGRDFYLFPAVAGSENLTARVLGKIRGKPIGFAQAIVARREKCDVTTLHKDWKKHKPEQYRDHEAYWRWSYEPSDLVVGDPVKVKIKGNDLFIQRPQGGDLKPISFVGNDTRPKSLQ